MPSAKRFGGDVPDLDKLRAAYEREANELVPWGRPFYKAATALIEALESALQAAESARDRSRMIREDTERIGMTWLKDRDAGRAEVTRLEAENAELKQGDALVFENARLRTERDELRSLLTEIAAKRFIRSYVGWDLWDRIQQYKAQDQEPTP